MFKIAGGAVLPDSAATCGATQIATPAIRDVRAECAAHVDGARGCMGNVLDDEKNRLKLPIAPGRRSGLAVGDANAGQFADAPLLVAPQQNRTTILPGDAACAFVEWVLDVPSSDDGRFVERFTRTQVWKSSSRQSRTARHRWSAASVHRRSGCGGGSAWAMPDRYGSGWVTRASRRIGLGESQRP